MTEEHLSGLTIARLATDEAEGLAAARAHAAACAHCAAGLAAARQADAASAPDFDAMWARIEAEAAPAPAPAPVEVVTPPPSLWSGVRASFGAAGALAAAVAVFVVARPADPPGPTGVRLKGGAPQLTLWDPASQRPLDGLPAAGVRFRVQAQCVDRCVVRLFHQAGAEAPTPLLDGSATLEPGQPTLLGLTAQISPEGQRERLIALFCAAPPGPGAVDDPAAAGCVRVARDLAGR